MLRLHLALGVALLVGVLPCSAAVTSDDAAELILTHARIDTPSGWAQALAVRRGVIVAVGSVMDVQVWRVKSACMLGKGPI